MSSTILVLKPGQVPPESYLDYLAAENKIVNFATQDGGSVVNLSFKKDVNWHVVLNNMFNQCKENPICLHYSSVEEEQPFPLISDGDNVILAAMLEGDFPAFAEAGHTNEFCTVRDYLADTCKQLYQASDQDLVKMMASVALPRFHVSLKGAFGHRAAVLLIPGTGVPQILSQNVMGSGCTGADFPWGWTTRTFPATKQVGATTIIEKPPAEKKLTAMERLLAKSQAGPPAENKPVITPPATLPDAAPEPGKTDTVMPPKAPEEKLIYFESGLSRQNLKMKMKRHLKDTALWRPGWDKLRLGYKASDFVPDSPMLEGFKTFEAAADKMKEVAAKVEEKKAAEAQVTTHRLPILGPTTKGTVFKQIQDGTLKSDPAKAIQDLEKPHDPFTKQVAIHENDPLFWPFDGFVEMDGYAAAVLLEEWRHRILKMDPKIVSQMLEQLTQPEKKVELTAMQKLLAKSKVA